MGKRAAEEGAQEGQLPPPPPPAMELGGQTYHFAPPPEILKGSKEKLSRKYKEQHYTSSVALGLFHVLRGPWQPRPAGAQFR